MKKTKRYPSKLTRSLISLSVVLAFSSFNALGNGTNRQSTEYRDTLINRTQSTTDADATQEEKDLLTFDRDPINDDELDFLLTRETERLGRFVSETMETMTSNAKSVTQFDLTVIAINENNSVAVSDLIAEEDALEAEISQREMQERHQVERFRRGEITEQELERVILSSIFPVKTTLKPTRLPSRHVVIDEAIAQQIHQPFAIIGTDRYSMEWFTSNLDVFRKLGAGVIVTQIDSLVDLEALQSLAPDLMFQPMDARDFLETIGVSVYPILISNQGVIQ
ncbi:integrating conjugative element protein [Vibrio metschnikovii]|nr:integrating conjugative element protein [Vibrio metschnikovii]EKO3892448.1 integrating conjugative element protein [Vibrio metschnikovii]